MAVQHGIDGSYMSCKKQLSIFPLMKQSDEDGQRINRLKRSSGSTHLIFRVYA
jgi:hypothetical protein